MNLVCRKLQMIIGESNGPPHDRVTNRLAAMIPKALAAGEEIPPEVAEFIAANELTDDLADALGRQAPKKAKAKAEAE